MVERVAARRDRALAVAAPAGIVALLIVSTLDGATRADGYQPLHHWISLLSLGERSTLGTLNLAVSAAAVLLGAIGLQRLLGGRPYGAATAALVAAIGVGILGAAAFPVDPVVGYPAGADVPATPSVDGRVHAVFGALLFLGCCLLGPTAVRLSGPRSRLRRCAMCCAAVAVGSVAVAFALVAAKGGERWDAAYAGTFQRLSLVAVAALLVALVVELRSERAWSTTQVVDR